MIQVERDIRVRSLIIGNKVAFARAIILSSLFNFYYFSKKKENICVLISIRLSRSGFRTKESIDASLSIPIRLSFSFSQAVYLCNFALISRGENVIPPPSMPIVNVIFLSITDDPAHWRFYPRELLILLTITSPRRGGKWRRRRRIEHAVSLVERITYLRLK